MTMTNLESGRSMVEMLGVLAVTGVLSIGGIAGYNYAINKHRANQVSQDIRLIYQEIKHPNIVRQIVADGTFPDLEIEPQSSYEYSFDFPNPEDFHYDTTSEKEPNLISVNVSGVSKTACDILLKTKPEYVLMLKANGESTWNCIQDENKLSYIFEITTDSLEYGTCSVCTGEHCFDDDLNCPEGENCQNNVCSKCARGYTERSDGSCHKCSDITTYKNTFTPENCLRCDGTFILNNNNGYCYSCKTGGGAWSAKKEHCESRCANNESTIWMGTNENDGWCGDCKNFGYYPWATKEQCEKCMKYNKNIIFYPKDANGTSTTGLCTTCNTKKADGTACECPDGQVWTFGDGNHSYCRQCGAWDGTRMMKTECDKCKDYYYVPGSTGNNRDGTCKACSTGQTKSADGYSCVDKPAS